MFITIINDCYDDNAAGRQIARLQAYFGTGPNIIGVKSDLEAGGNLIDVLDAVEDRPGIILVNVAPRNGQAKKWKNGTPFGYFKFKQTTVIAPISGLVLNFVKKFELARKIKQIDLEATARKAILENYINESVEKRIVSTQFRSFEFLPRLAFWIKQGLEPIASEISLDDIPDLDLKIWWVDNFGNCKTTALCLDDIKPALPGLKHYSCLKDVPDNELALVHGSSGFENKRFIEIVKQGGNACADLKAILSPAQFLSLFK